MNDFAQSPSSGEHTDPVMQSWSEFDRRYPDEASCRAAVLHALSMQTVLCSKCKKDEFIEGRDPRLMRCKNCRTERSRTVGTFFERVKKVRPWLGAIWLFGCRRMCSTLMFSKLANVAYSTGWMIQQKIALVLAANMGSEEVEPINADQFNLAILKRSRSTPALRHPSAEVGRVIEQELESYQAADKPEGTNEEDGNVSVEESFQMSEDIDLTKQLCSLSEEERRLYDLIAKEPTNFDGLCSKSGLSVGAVASALTIFEISGMIKQRADFSFASASLSIEGTQSTQANDDRLTIVVRTFVETIKNRLHGISLKHLQSYLARFWYLSIAGDMKADALLRWCSQFRHITAVDVYSVCSRKIVSIVLP